MDNKRPLAAHISLFLACVFWGLMAPVGKDAMAHGISGTALVTLRVAGAAALFWAASLFTARERVPGRDLVRLLFAGLLGLVFNQCCYIIGLSMTSPVNASIVTTTLPIITRAAGRPYAVVSIFHGCVLDFSVPFLVTFFCSL